jgi:hypothetical protein
VVFPIVNYVVKKTSSIKHIGIIVIQTLYFSHRTHSLLYLKNLCAYVVFPNVNYVVKNLAQKGMKIHKF